MYRLGAVLITSLALLLPACGDSSSGTPAVAASPKVSQACVENAAFKTAFTAWGAKWQPLVSAATADVDVKARAGALDPWRASWINTGTTLANSATELRAIRTPAELYLDLQGVVDATDKSARIAAQFGSSSVAYFNQNHYLFEQSAADQGTAVTKLSYDMGVWEGLNSCA